MKDLDEVITAMDGADFTCTNCALQHDCDECECILADAFQYLKEYRHLAISLRPRNNLIDTLRKVRGEK